MNNDNCENIINETLINIVEKTNLNYYQKINFIKLLSSEFKTSLNALIYVLRCSIMEYQNISQI